MFDKIYRGMNEKIAPDGDLIRDTARQAQEERGHRRARPRRAMAFAAVLLVVFTAGPRLAARIPAGYELMYLLSPELAQHFAPVQRSCVDNGIAMEVVGTYIHGNEAEIYITMRDLESDRVDATIDLFDSYSIHKPFSFTATCERVGYDEESRTATFLISMQADRSITGKKITFSVREFISRKTAIEDIPVALSVDRAGGETHWIDWNGYSMPDNGEEPPDRCEALMPGDSLYSPGDGLDVTAAGYVDGRLHIQLRMQDRTTLDHHGYFYFLNADGEQVDSSCSFSFREGEGDTGYQEFVFDIPREEIGDYDLYGSFWLSGLNTKGDWQVTFPLVKEE